MAEHETARGSTAIETARPSDECNPLAPGQARLFL